MKSAVKSLALALALVTGLSLRAAEPAVKVVDTIGGVTHDFWARSNAEFCHDVMSRVFAEAGLSSEHLPQDEYAVEPPQEAELVCSLFRTPRNLARYLFPLQPLSRMRFALYARAERAAELKTTPVVSWPHLKVAYSPVLQGVDDDRERFFAANALTPEAISYATSVSAVEAVVKGEADVLFLYTPVGQSPTNLTEILEVGQRNVYFGVRKDRFDLFERLAKAYRQFYVREIAAIDDMRRRHFGVEPPTNRVRLAAYESPGILSVTGDGIRLGFENDALDVIRRSLPMTVDWVYGSYAESAADVEAARLDVMADFAYRDGFRRNFLYGQIPLGVPRIVLLAKPESAYVPNRVKTWNGMRIGVLAGFHKIDRLREHFDGAGVDVTFVPHARDAELVEAYRADRVDAVVTIIRPELSFEKELMTLMPEPLHFGISRRRPDLVRKFDSAMRAALAEEPGLPDFHASRYGCFETKSDPGFTVGEMKWLEARSQSGKPVTVVFTPSDLTVEGGTQARGFSAYLFEELTRITGLPFKQVLAFDARSSRQLLLNGDVELWSAYPYRAVDLHGQAKPVFAVPVPQYYVRRAGTPKNTLLRGVMAIDRHDASRIKAFVHRQMTGHVVLCDSVEDCYRALLDGRADCLQCSMPEGDRAMAKLRLWGKVESEIYLSLRHRDEYELVSGPATPPELVDILRKAIYSISTEQMRSFFTNDERLRQEREMAANEAQRLSRRSKLTLVWCGVAVIVIGFVALVLFAVGQYRLARTEREARLKVDEADKSRRKFLSAVSHDVRTPLNAILGFSELLATREGNDAELQTGLDEIRKGGQALLGLMDDIAGLFSGAPVPDITMPVGDYAHPLVVDDSSVNVSVFQSVLAKLAITDVAVASDGEEALRLLEKDPRIDIVFTDLWMARMGGEDLVRRLRADRRLATLPVYAVTTYAEAGEGLEEKGFTGIVVKPVSVETIRSILMKIRGGGGNKR